MIYFPILINCKIVIFPAHISFHVIGKTWSLYHILFSTVGYLLHFSTINSSSLALHSPFGKLVALNVTFVIAFFKLKKNASPHLSHHFESLCHFSCRCFYSVRRMISAPLKKTIVEFYKFINWNLSSIIKRVNFTNGIRTLLYIFYILELSIRKNRYDLYSNEL